MKLNSIRLGLHWQYYRWRYIIFVLAALLAANFLFTATQPQIPYDQKVDIFIFSGIGSTDVSSAWEKDILRILPPDQKAVSIMSTPVVQGQENTIYQLAGARMSAGEGLIWILPVDLFNSFARSGAFIALDSRLSGFNLATGADLSLGTVVVQPDENMPGESHICGIPLDSFLGIGGLFIPNGMIMAFPVYAESNYSSAVAAANWFFAKTEEPQAPADPNQFTVAIASNYFATDDTDAWQKKLQDVLRLPAVNVSLLPYHTGREDMVTHDLAASRVGKPGLCVVSRDVFVALARGGSLTPLDGSVSKLRVPAGVDLSAGRETAAAKGNVPGTEHLYGIPLDNCAGLSELFNPSGMFAVVPVQPEDSFPFAIDAANWLLAKTEMGK